MVPRRENMQRVADVWRKMPYWCQGSEVSMGRWVTATQITAGRNQHRQHLQPVCVCIDSPASLLDT